MTHTFVPQIVPGSFASGLFPFEDSTEEQVNRILQAKYARDRRWDLNGRLIARSLLAPGCPACRAVAEFGNRDLGFLLHERVNDPESVVRLIEARGLCRAHAARLRQLDEVTYGDQLKEVLIYGHLVEALRRHLASGQPLPDALRPVQSCPICELENAAVTAVLPWLVDGVAVPEIRVHLADGDGLCLDHLAAARTHYLGRESSLWEFPRLTLVATRQAIAAGRTIDGDLARRVSVLLGGGWPGDAASLPRSPTCAVCREVAEVERDALALFAFGAEESSAMAGDELPCGVHVRSLQSMLARRPWPVDLVARLLYQADRRLHTSEHSIPDSVLSRLPIPRWRARKLTAPADAVGCPVCQAIRSAEARLLARPGKGLAETTCVRHLRGLTENDWQRGKEMTPSLMLRLNHLSERLEGTIHTLPESRAAWRSHLAGCSDDLVNFFVPVWEPPQDNRQPACP